MRADGHTRPPNYAVTLCTSYKKSHSNVFVLIYPLAYF